MKPYWAPLHTKEKKWHQKSNYLLFKAGQKIELLASTSEDGVIAKYIEKRGEGIHHIAFHVDDIYAEMQRLREAGFTLYRISPKGADGKLVCFVHPKGTNGYWLSCVWTMTSDNLHELGTYNAPVSSQSITQYSQ